ncbi:MAG TPA: PilZ domain-containing protein [Gammaproteobacteria bacterium]|nr:PilZ domain-containing protein [Gammaproteobacteria bacterium]
MRIELRKTPRTPQQLAISYHRKSTDNPDKNPIAGTLLDLGDGGASLLVETPLGIDEQLRLEGHPKLNGACNCVVRWVRKLPENYQLGVQFL